MILRWTGGNARSLDGCSATARRCAPSCSESGAGGAHERRTGDDQPRARPAKFQRRPDCNPGRKNGGGRKRHHGRRRYAEAFAREKNVSRLPVWETRDGRRRIAGLLAVNTWLFSTMLDLQNPASMHMTPALFMEEDVRLEIALRRMQRAGQRLAVVLARDGSEAGIATLEDILKLMFGEVKL